MKYDHQECCLSNFAGPIACVLITTIIAFGCILYTEGNESQYVKGSSSTDVKNHLEETPK